MIKSLLISLFLATGFISTASGPWFQRADFAGVARHRTTSFSIGTMGYLGLGHINSAIDEEYEDFWKFDPASNSWTQVADYPEGKMYHAAVFVIGITAYVGTGRYENGNYSYKFHAYSPQTNTWAPIADFIGFPRRGAVAFSLNGKGYVGTGEIIGGYTNTFYEYDPLLNQWTTKANFPGTPRTSAVGFSIGNHGYLGTGETILGSVNDFYQYNPTLNQWTVKAPLGTTNRQEAHAFALNGKGYVGTGVDLFTGENFRDFWEYDPNLDVWDQKDDFAGTARRYLSGFVIGSRAYMGTGTNGTNFQDFWMYDPALSSVEELLPFIDISLSPNPAKDVLSILVGQNISGIQPDKLQYSIFDCTGKEMKKSFFDQEELKIDVALWSRGTYIVSFFYEGKRIKSEKLILGQ